MYLADYHTHSRCSPDGSATLLEMLRGAERAGMDELCLTDHCDLLDMRGVPDGSFRWGPIEEEFARLCKTPGPKGVTVRWGLELGEGWEDPALAEEITGHPMLDFVIGSVHNLSREDGGLDFYFVDYKDEATCHRILAAYLRCLARLAETESYDVLGHIIYPLRYMNGRDGNAVSLKPYFQELEQVMGTVIRKGKGIEVNTCRGETVEDWRELLALYRDCGGEIVTLGSDAHRPGDVGAGIPQAARLLREFGFSLAVYEKRTPKLIKI